MARIGISDDAAARYLGIIEQRIRHVVQSCYEGKRIVIFSGGAAKGTKEVLEEIEGE